MATLLGLMSVLNSTLATFQRIRYASRIAGTDLVEAPIFVVGHWRAGTTLLHELLVLDTRFTFPNTYACFSPNHFLVSEGWLKRLVGIFLPRQRPMDNMAIGWDLPQEDEWALCNMGLPSPYFKIMFPNETMADRDYQTLMALTPAARRHWQTQFHWFLRCLTVRSPKPIVLKTPVHTFRINALLELFPHAKFIHITRNPFGMIPSTVHTWRRMYRYHGLQVPKFEHLEADVLQTFTDMYEAFEVDKRNIAAEQFCQTSYEALSENPTEELEKIYAHFKLAVSQHTRASWRAYADRTNSYQTNRYQPLPEQKDQIVRSCSAYFDNYGYDREGAE